MCSQSQFYVISAKKNYFVFFTFQVHDFWRYTFLAPQTPLRIKSVILLSELNGL
jgi:hypothetical protein